MFVQWVAETSAEFVESLPIIRMHFERIADEATL